MKIEVTTNPAEDDLQVLSQGIRSYNKQHIGDAATEEDLTFAVFAKNDSGKTTGGIKAVAFWNWLYIEHLWLENEARGTRTGSRLLSEAEGFAMKNGFFLSRLETTDFQAREFYEKQGYEVFAELNGLPKGSTVFFMKKELIAESS